MGHAKPKPCTDPLKIALRKIAIQAAMKMNSLSILEIATSIDKIRVIAETALKENA